MKCSLAQILRTLGVVGTLLCAGLLRAEESQKIKITLHPMAAPSPALKYRLLPPATDQISGNAAVPYGKVTAEQWVFFPKYANTDVISEWQEMPLDKIRVEKISLPESSITFLEQGARCKYCDWQLPIATTPFYTILLPEAQQTRTYARLLAVKARGEIAEGKFEDAVKTFSTNYALGRNVAQGETLVHGLIGIAICGIMYPQVSEYVQQPAAPNLYWALTNLPMPLVDMRAALDVESRAFELSFPELRDLETARRTPEEWREIFQRFAKLILQWNASGPSPPGVKTPAELDEACERILPAAKRSMIAAGLPAERVDAMPMHQIALLHTVRNGHRIFDDVARYYTLPFPEALEGMEAVMARIAQEKDDNREVVPVVSHTVEALLSTRKAIVRNEREFSVLRIFEALRIYAAAHDGQLPQHLAEITEVPVPNDPVTGKPFEFTRDGEKAQLRGPVLRDRALDVEITMAAK